jgi:hypothetical protein
MRSIMGWVAWFITVLLLALLLFHLQQRGIDEPFQTETLQELRNSGTGGD